jgi:hypothetical protein
LKIELTFSELDQLNAAFGFLQIIPHLPQKLNHESEKSFCILHTMGIFPGKLSTRHKKKKKNRNRKFSNLKENHVYLLVCLKKLMKATDRSHLHCIFVQK